MSKGKKLKLLIRRNRKLKMIMIKSLKLRMILVKTKKQKSKRYRIIVLKYLKQSLLIKIRKKIMVRFIKLKR